MLQHSNLHYFTPVFVSKISIRNGNIASCLVAELTDLNRNLMMSIDIVPVPTDEAVREAESRLLGVETNITNWQRKQNQKPGEGA